MTTPGAEIVSDVVMSFESMTVFAVVMFDGPVYGLSTVPAGTPVLLALGQPVAGGGDDDDGVGVGVVAVGVGVGVDDVVVGVGVGLGFGRVTGDLSIGGKISTAATLNRSRRVPVTASVAARPCEPR